MSLNTGRRKQHAKRREKRKKKKSIWDLCLSSFNTIPVSFSHHCVYPMLKAIESGRLKNHVDILDFLDFLDFLWKCRVTAWYKQSLMRDYTRFSLVVSSTVPYNPRLRFIVPLSSVDRNSIERLLWDHSWLWTRVKELQQPEYEETRTMVQSETHIAYGLTEWASNRSQIHGKLQGHLLHVWRQLASTGESAKCIWEKLCCRDKLLTGSKILGNWQGCFCTRTPRCHADFILCSQCMSTTAGQTSYLRSI